MPASSEIESAESPGEPSRITPSDLGACIALYTIGVLFFASHLVRATVPTSLTVAAVLLVVGVYVLDRVKIRDAYAETADAVTNYRRHYGLRMRSTAARFFAASCLVAAATIFGIVRSDLLWMIVAGPVAVIVYAGSPRTWTRLKAIPVLKNVLPAIAFTLLAWGVLGYPSQAAWSVWAIVFGRVAIDAALCDLDDIEADTASGIRTLAAWLGRPLAGFLLVLGEIALAVVIVVHARNDLSAAWALLPLSTTMMLLLLDRVRLTDLIDARLGVFAIIIALIETLPAS